MPGHLQSIVSLNATLAELVAADRRLSSIPDWMSDLHQEHSGKKAGIDAVAEEVAAADQKRREAEAALEDAQAQLKRYQEQLSKVSTTREYGALLTEIDTTKNQIRDNEHTALEATERKETAEARLAELREAFRDLDERYNAELEKWEREKPAVAESAEQLRARSEELRARVPRNVLVLFDRLYEKSDGQPLARIRKMTVARGNAMWHCDACSYSVRPQVLVEIRDRGTLNQCDSCKRILYWLEGDEE